MHTDENGRVLVVDDEPSTLEFLRALLQKRGYRVDGVTKGEEGVSRAVAGDYDVILCDLKLPDIDGTEVLQRIRRQKSDAVVVILTGYASLPTALRAIELGAYDYVDKRAGGSEILHRVEKALNYSRVQRESEQRQRNLGLLTRFAYEVNRSLDPETVLDSALPLLQSATGADALLVFGYEEQLRTYRLLGDLRFPDRLRRLARVGWREVPIPVGEFVSLNDLVSRAEQSPREKRRWQWLAAEFATVFAEPLQFGGKTVGFVAAFYRTAPARLKATTELLRGMAHHLALALNNARLHTETRKLLRSLRESEQKYRGLFENSREGVCLIVDGTVRLANQALCDMLRCGRDEIIGQPFTAGIHPDDAGEIVRRYYRRLRGFDEPTRYEARLVRKDGSVVDVECEVSVIELEGERGVQVFVRDISERKRSLRKLQQRNRELVALAEVARAANQSLDMDGVLHNGLRAAMRVVRADMGKIYLLDSEGQQLHLAACLGEDSDWWKLSPVPIGNYFSGKAVASKQPIHIPDSHSAEAIATDPELARAPRCSFLAVPLLHGGRPLGAMNLGRKVVGGFSKEEEGLVRAIASTVALALANSGAHRRAVEQVRQLRLLLSHTYALAQSSSADQVGRCLLEASRAVGETDVALVALRESATRFRVVTYMVDGELRTPENPAYWEPGAEVLSRLGMGVAYCRPEELGNLPVPFEVCASVVAIRIGTESEAEGALLLGSRNKGLEEERLVALQMLAGHAGEAIRRARLLEALSRSEQRFRRMYDLTPDAILLLGKGGKILEANQHAFQLMGWPPSALVGKRLGDLLTSEEDLDAVFSTLNGTGASEPLVRECSIRTGKGHKIPVELRLVPFPSETGGGWLALLHDLSEYKAYENALQRQKEFSERIIQNAGVLIVGGHNDGSLAICNRRVAEVTGFEPSELENGNWRKLFWPSSARERIGQREWEKWVQCKNGQRRYLRFTETDLFDETGQKAGVIAFGQDLTELRHMQAQLVQTEKLAALGELISGITHEINNPLTGIIGYTQLLLASDLDESTRADLEVIYKEAQRCKGIVGNLLRFARGESTAKKLLDINQVVRSVVELKGYTLRVEGVDLQIELSQQLPPVLGNETELQQVVLNLLTNAQQAFPPEQQEKRIRIRTEREKGEVVLWVEDNGQGISPDVLDRIWDPFFTTKEVGRGTGLGLSVCLGIVRDHAGTIRVTRTGPGGTVFEVRLPAAKSTRVDQGETEPSGTEARSVANTRRGTLRQPKVLVVDDEKSVTEVLKRLLQQMGFETECASDGDQALELLRSRDFDLIFCDVKMPHMTGVEFVRKAREKGRQLADRVIMMSGDLLNPETELFLREFRGPVLKKPFVLEDVERLLSEWSKKQAGAQKT